MTTATLELTVDSVYRMEGDGNLKAFADVTVAGALVVKGFRVLNGKKGLFVSMPRHAGKNEQWYDSVIPLSPDVRQQLNDVVMTAYNAPSA